MESGRHFRYETYPYYMKNVPGPVDGFITAPDGPGLGLEVRPEIFEDGEATIVPILEI